jgi:hypothetical protein
MRVDDDENLRRSSIKKLYKNYTNNLFDFDFFHGFEKTNYFDDSRSN